MLIVLQLAVLYGANGLAKWGAPWEAGTAAAYALQSDAYVRFDTLPVLAGLAPAPSTHVRPPRIAASPVSFECVNHATVVTGPHQSIVIGRILAVHVADAHVQDAERGYIDTRSLDLVARTAGSGYARTRDTFDLVRPTWSDWQKRQSPTESVKQGDRP
mgnify:CR=1 FL=1